jgi:hypothetical protein
MRQCKWLAQTLPTCSRLRAFHPGKDPNRRLESARIAAVRELLDRRYGRARQTTEVIRPENDLLLDDIDRRDRITEREKAFRWHGSEKHGR